MPLVTSTEMFKKAYDGGYAIGAFNVNNMEIVQGITEACQEEHAPVILQVSKGARAYTRTASAHARSPKVAAVDTTGAGDGFIGSFLWQLQRDGVTAAELPKLSRKRLTEYLTFSNRFCAISVQHHGAIDSYPTLEQMEQPETDFPLP